MFSVIWHKLMPNMTSNDPVENTIISKRIGFAEVFLFLFLVLMPGDNFGTSQSNCRFNSANSERVRRMLGTSGQAFQQLFLQRGLA